MSSRSLQKASRYLALVLFGVLILAMGELLLRAAWEPSPDTPMGLAWTSIDPFRKDGASMVTKGAFQGSVRSSRFAAEKPRAMIRILCIGGSTTFGFPFKRHVAWPSILERRLRALYPNLAVEVINAGGNAYGSSRTLGLLRGTLKYDPDLVIVICGDAEFVEDSYRNAVGREETWLSVVRSLRLSRAVSSLLFSGRRRPASVDIESLEKRGIFFSPGLDGTVYEPTAERRREVTALFEKNIHEIVRTCRKERVPVLMSTIPSNFADWPPEGNDEGPGDPVSAARWNSLVRQARKMEALGRDTDALSLYREAASLWDKDPDVLFRYGRLLVRTGRADEGKALLIQARDLDALPVRATSVTNETIRRTAGERSAILVDLERVFEQEAVQGLVGEELIFDYAHPSPRGHVEIAREVWRVMTGFGAPWSDYSPETEAELRTGEGADLEAAPQLTADLAFALGETLLKKGKLERALGMYREAISLGYGFPSAPFGVAKVHYLRGEAKEAIALMEEIVARHPGFTRPFPFLAALYQGAGNRGKTIHYFRLAIQNGETGRRAFLGLATALMEEGRPEGAEGAIEEGLALHHDDCDLLALKGRVLESSGSIDRSEAWQRDIVSRNPECTAAWENLGVSLMNRKSWGQAETVFREALKHDPSHSTHHLNLGYVYYWGFKDASRALDHFRVYYRDFPERLSVLPRELREDIEK